VAWVKIDPIELPKLPHLMELMDRELPVPHLPIRPLPNRPLTLASKVAKKIGRRILRPNYLKKTRIISKIEKKHLKKQWMIELNDDW
jgi:hypothetical protein